MSRSSACLPEQRDRLSILSEPAGECAVFCAGFNVARAAREAEGKTEFPESSRKTSSMRQEEARFRRSSDETSKPGANIGESIPRKGPGRLQGGRAERSRQRLAEMRQEEAPKAAADEISGNSPKKGRPRKHPQGDRPEKSVREDVTTVTYAERFPFMESWPRQQHVLEAGRLLGRLSEEQRSALAGLFDGCEPRAVLAILRRLAFGRPCA